jgi:GNAT superfamily N-acetyltransferase
MMFDLADQISRRHVLTLEHSPAILLCHSIGLNSVPPLNARTLNHVKIRLATARDAEQIARFNQAMALETENKVLDWATISAGVERMVASPELGFYLVTEKSNETGISGCLGVTFEWSDWRNGLFWWIQSVYIAPDFRAQGVFSSMYQEVTRLAHLEPDVIGVRLYAEQDNQRALSTYFKLGMIETDYRLLEALFNRSSKR